MLNKKLAAFWVSLICLLPVRAQEPVAVATVPADMVFDGQGFSLVFEDAAGCAGQCCQQNFWLTGDYMFIWMRSASLPPLVTTSPPTTPQQTAGVLGQPTTTVLFGGGNVNGDLRSGYRLNAGYWFHCAPTLGIETGFMMVESNATNFSDVSNGSTIIARPFVNALTGLQDSVLIAYPGSRAGSIDVQATSGNFYQAHVDFADNLCNTPWMRLDCLLGYRFFRYDDGLRIRQVIMPTSGPFEPGTQIVSTDNFSAQNEFHGCDLGLRTRFIMYNTVSLDLLTKLAVGNLNRTVKVNGNQLTTVPGFPPADLPGGVLALNSNSGVHTSNDWTVVPELGVTVGWQITSHLQLRLGYSLLVLTEIARAGAQVDTTLNPNFFPGEGQSNVGPRRPGFSLSRSDMFIQSVNLGLEFTF